MHWPRTGIVVGVIGLVLLGAGWWLAATGTAGSTHRVSAIVKLIGQRPAAPAPLPTATWTPVGPRPPAPLLRALQQVLALSAAPTKPHPRSIPVPAPNAVIRPHGTTCAVAAGGFCSLQPCTVYAGQGAGYVTAALAQAVVVKPGRLGATTCQGHAAPPRILRIAGF